MLFSLLFQKLPNSFLDSPMANPFPFVLMAFIGRTWRSLTQLSIGGVDVSQSRLLVRLRVDGGLVIEKGQDANDLRTTREGGQYHGYASGLQVTYISGVSYGQQGVIFGNAGETG